MAKKKAKKKKKIELTPEEKAVPVQEVKDPDAFALTQDGLDDMGEPELSETPVIKGEQATMPIVNGKHTTINVTTPETESQTEAVTTVVSAKSGRMPRTIDDIPTIPRPEVIKEPEPTPISVPVICAGCKATVESSTTRACPHCPGSLVFCPTCAKPGTCHKCGKALSK